MVKKTYISFSANAKVMKSGNSHLVFSNALNESKEAKA